MATPKFPFTVTEHVIHGQHVREYPDVTVSADAKLKLVCAQAIHPIRQPQPQSWTW